MDMNEQLIEGVAKAIYSTHLRPGQPVWENTSENVRQWVRDQARAALAFLLFDEEC